jgi:hypothetical protein
MGCIRLRFGIVSSVSLVLATLSLGGCFYSPATSSVSPQSNIGSPVVIYGRPDDGDAPVAEETSSHSVKHGRAPNVADRPEPTDDWIEDDHKGAKDDAALRKKLVICTGCTPTKRPRKQETVEQFDSSDLDGK